MFAIKAENVEFVEKITHRKSFLKEVESIILVELLNDIRKAKQ